MLSNVYLCTCRLGILKEEDGKIVEREIPKSEKCLGVNGNYYNLMDFKKYKVGVECTNLDEEYILEVKRLNERKLSPETIEWLNSQKNKLLKQIDEKKQSYESIDDFLTNLPHIEMVVYSLGKVVLHNGVLGLIDISDGIAEAILYQGDYYDLNTGERIQTDKDECWPGDIIGYNFLGLNLSDMSKKEYQEKMLRISMLLIKLSSESQNNNKVFVMR